MSGSIDSVMIVLYTGEDASLKRVSFILLFSAVAYIIMGYPNKRVE